MSEPSTALVESRPKSVLLDMADRFGMEPAAFEATLRATVCKGSVSREEFAAFLLVAKEYGLNPLTKEIYAFPAKGGGIIPVVSIDGWCRITNDHVAMDGLEFADTRNAAGELEAITCKIFRKDRAHATEVTEYMEECKGTTDVWKRWPRRMLRHKTLIQAARYAFGFSGIYDEDEYERIQSARDVTPEKVDLVGRLSAGANEAAGFSAEHVEAEVTPKRRGRPPKAAAEPEVSEVLDAVLEGDDLPQAPADAPNVEEPSDTKESAMPASTVSAEETSGLPDTSEPTSDGEPQEADVISEGYPNENEVYLVNGDEWIFDPRRGDERRTTYKNGDIFSDAGRDKGYRIYEDHAPEGGTQTDTPEPEEEGLPPEMQTYVDAIENVTTFVDAKWAMQAFFVTPTFKEMAVPQQNRVRRDTAESLMERRGLITDLPDHADDISMFRLWIEAQDDPEAISGTWSVLIRSSSFSTAPKATQEVLLAAKDARIASIGGDS